MIDIIDINTLIKEGKLTEPVTTDQFYLGKSMNFHPMGLYSENIFGVEGSIDRKKTLSWIELNCKAIHPVIHDILRKRIFQKIDLLLSGEKQFSLDENGYLIETDGGEIDGMQMFSENISKIRFSKHEDEEGNRNKIIDMIYYNINRGTFFLDKLIVVSPDFRPISIMEDTGEQSVDDLSKLYQKIIRSANQISGISGPLYDILSYRIQLLLRDLYELVKVKTSKKTGAIRQMMLGKRVDFSARAVITPGPTLDIGQVGLPIRVACQIFEPQLLYGLINSPDAKKIPREFHDEVIKFLAKEETFT